VTFAEARAPYATPPNKFLGAQDLPGLPTYVSALAGMSGAPSESGVCLYMALSQGRSGVQTTPDIVLNSSELKATTRADGSINADAKMILDAWRTPLIFSRWPYKNTELNLKGMEPSPPWRDREDPEGLLSDPAWVGSDGHKAFMNLCHPTDKKKSYMLQPVIVSAGPNKDFGLKNPITLEVDKPNAANDNIYSYRLRLGGSQ
jgi:hypothetical protein